MNWTCCMKPQRELEIHLFQLRMLPWTMFQSLHCTMVNPFVAGSLILFTFIEIMEILNFPESFQVQWLLKFLSMTELKISFLKSHSKKLEASSFNNIKWKFTAMIILHFHLQPQFKNELFHILHIIKWTCRPAWLSCIFAWARILVIGNLIDQINTILFFIQFSKNFLKNR